MSKRGEFAAWLEHRIAARDPAAIVRLGEGEARLLVAHPDDASSMRAANELFKREAGCVFSVEAVLGVRAALEHARDEADVLGVLGHDQQTETREISKGRLEALHAERAAAGKPPVTLAHCMLNHAILPRLPGMLKGRRVAVISCRDVRPAIEDRWGLEDVAVYRVPSQHCMRDVDGAYEAALHDSAIWPDAHDRVCAELAVRERGEVFLVGAGVFGKDLCIRVRDRGGIALDMGSALDHLAGKLTRPFSRRVFELHAAGMSIPEITAHIHDQLGAQIDPDNVRNFIDLISQGGDTYSRSDQRDDHAQRDAPSRR